MEAKIEERSSRSENCEESGVFSKDPARDKVIKGAGWGQLTDDNIKLIASYSPILEVFAGSGYIAARLKKAGASVVATDIKGGPKIHYYPGWNKLTCAKEVIAIDAIDAVKKFPSSTLLMVWPPLNNEVATNALKEFKGATLIYVGEAKGGSNATGSFFLFGCAKLRCSRRGAPLRSA
ncbi:MAG: hypothetical protein KGL39_24025 [Patescibacteria group bacterium]|nr:hypothetical protein [Patescibacteria group bacterium]